VRSNPVRAWHARDSSIPAEFQMRITDRGCPVILLAVLGLIGLSFVWFQYVSSGSVAGIDRARLDGKPDPAHMESENACSSASARSGCVSLRRSDAGFARRPFAYDEKASLYSQLHSLEAKADRGDPYASCVLARALDICLNEEHLLDLESLEEGIDAADEDALKSMEGILALSRSAKAMCEGLDEKERSTYFQRLINSASLGDVKSMSRLTSFQLTAVDGVDAIAQRYESFYKNNAERMLNDSALAGEPEAILSVYHAYSSGQFAILNGFISVDVDMPKALAAARTLAAFSDERQSEELRAFIDSASRLLIPSEAKRMQALESTYRRNYRKKTKGKAIHSIDREDFPDVYCAKGRF